MTMLLFIVPRLLVYCIGEGALEIGERTVARVLVGQDGLVHGNAPVDAQAIVQDADAGICLGVVELVALVLEHGRLAEHGKAVGKALGDEELAVVLCGKFHGHMLAIGGRPLADVHGHVENPTAYTSYKFRLRVGRALEVQASHHAIGAHALVVLDEVHVPYPLLELALGEGLEEVATRILEDTRFQYQQPLNTCLNYVHLYKIVSVLHESWSLSPWE